MHSLSTPWPPIMGEWKEELRDTLKLPAGCCCTCPAISAEAGIQKSRRKLCHAFPINPLVPTPPEADRISSVIPAQAGIQV